MSTINQVLSFSKFLMKFREVERTIFFSYNARKENDAEHSRQLAMLARYIISLDKLNLSMEKVLHYCMIHDLLEVYAGDMEALNRTPEAQKAKEQKEIDSFIRIKSEFPEAHELRNWLEKYEHREDEESKFVYALDKMMPVINLYNDGGYRRKWRKVGLEMELLPSKEGKVHAHPLVSSLWKELCQLMKEHESQLFYM